MSELKNCPFCGSPAVHIKNNMGVNYITCSNTYEQSKGDCAYDIRVSPKVWSRREVLAEITALKDQKEKNAKALEALNWLETVCLRSPEVVRPYVKTIKEALERK